MITGGHSTQDENKSGPRCIFVAQEVKSKSLGNWQVVCEVCLGVKPHLGLMARFLVMGLATAALVITGCPLWRAGGVQKVLAEFLNLQD
jgi:hypothetical protein